MNDFSKKTSFLWSVADLRKIEREIAKMMAGKSA